MTTLLESSTGPAPISPLLTDLTTVSRPRRVKNNVMTALLGISLAVVALGLLLVHATVVR